MKLFIRTAALAAFLCISLQIQIAHAGFCSQFFGEDDVKTEAKEFVGKIAGTYRIVEAQDIDVFDSNGKKVLTNDKAKYFLSGLALC